MRIVALQAENIKRLAAVEIRPDGNIVEITGRNGQGKQQPVSEPVLTPAGWVPIGEIGVGDEVIGSSGAPTVVTGVFPQRERTTFEVTMVDGGRTRCGPDHLWTVTRWRSGERHTETLTTADLIDGGLRHGSARKWEVPLVGPVEFADSGQELPIDPYTLGVILGDGHIEPTGYVTVTSHDPAILDALKADGWRTETEVGTGLWSRPLRHLGLAGLLAHQKFIPDAYLRATPEERRDLLAGLLDSDGSAPSSWAYYHTTSERLAQGVVDLALSLGYIASTGNANPKRYRYKGEPRTGRPAWNVLIKSDVAPFALERKAVRWSPSTQRPMRRFIDTIEPVTDEDSVCIQVAADDGLYVTNDFIVTHNTSVLDAIWWALAGTKNVQRAPIRDGQEQATIRLDLGELVVTRTFKRKGDDGDEFTTSLAVDSADGASYRSPQTMLDAMLGELAFDPLEFARLKPREQFDRLKQFVPDVDFAAIEEANRADYDRRRDLNREAKQLRAQADGVEVPPVPEPAPPPVATLEGKLGDAAEHNADIERQRQEREQQRLRIVELSEEADGCRNRAEQLRKEAAELEEKAETLTAMFEEREEELEGLDPLPDPIDVTKVREQLTVARQAEQATEAATRRQQLLDQAKAVETSASELTTAMEQRQKQLTDAVAAAQMPVDNLTFGDGEILLDGHPFEQASDAEQLRTSVAIAMAANPKLRVVRVRDGSLLDEDAMQLLAQMADEADCQVWVERVDSSGRVGFVIEDGTVVARAAEEVGADA